jgi:hypothetical protein
MKMYIWRKYTRIAVKRKKIQRNINYIFYNPDHAKIWAKEMMEISFKF